MGSTHKHSVLLFFLQAGGPAEPAGRGAGEVHVRHPHVLEAVPPAPGRDAADAEGVQRSLHQVLQVRCRLLT